MRLLDFYVVKKKPPHNNSVWIRTVAHIKDKETGEIREYADDGLWNEERKEPATFIWEEGNYSCDCNRGLFFARAKNEEDLDCPCVGDRFDVNLENPKNGEIFYREFE